MIGLDELHRAQGDRLREAGMFASAWLADAYAAIPRHLFAPEMVYIGDEQVYRSDELERWANAVYGGLWDGLVTKVTADGVPLSSMSAPAVVLGMLAAVDLEPGQTVLEIGTGTGWNAALLSYRVGAAGVVTLDIDAEVIDGAARALSSGGYHPQIQCADGELGWHCRAPFDRILATAAVSRIPSAWVQQAAAGGIIHAPWQTTFFEHGSVRLIADGQGSASGRFGEPLSFMPLRAHRYDSGRLRFPDLDGDEWDQAVRRGARGELGRLDDYHADFAVGLQLPGVWRVYDELGEIRVVWLYSDDSWAICFPDEVRQWGPRSLADEVADALDRWEQNDSPDMSEFGLTVTRSTHRIWLRDPGNVLGEL